MLNKTIDIIDRAGGWLLWQIDHNDVLEGFAYGLILFLLPWFFGIIDIVVR